MKIEIAILSGILSYLIGSISFTRLVTRFVSPQLDIENVTITSSTGDESSPLRSMGATTASIELGPRWGCSIGILDILKVAIPVLAFRLLFPEQYYFLIAGVFGMLGHNWPIYYRFNGGSGMSSIYGAFFVIDWIGAIVCSFGGMLLGFYLVKDILVAYMAGAWLMIPWLWFRTHDVAYVVFAIAMNMMYIFALIPEIRAQIKARREGNADMTNAMESFPMGRGMLKIMRYFGAEPKQNVSKDS